MRIFKNAFEAAKTFPGPVLAIGKFDGMHRGHQKIIRLAVRKAKALKTACLVVTLDPSPEQFLRLYPYRPLLAPAKRLEALAALGVAGVVLLPFDQELACLSPGAFAKNILALQLRPVCVFVGADFCFGRDRAGSAQTLRELGAKLGFSVRTVPLLAVRGEKVSAPMIRGLLDRGRIREAEELLGWKTGRGSGR